MKMKLLTKKFIVKQEKNIRKEVAVVRFVALNYIKVSISVVCVVVK